MGHPKQKRRRCRTAPQNIASRHGPVLGSAHIRNDNACPASILRLTSKCGCIGPGGPHRLPIAAAIGEPARARMLYCLMDDRARTSTELAVLADVSPSTASVHLSRLKAERLVLVHAQGKHRYYRLAGPQVARVLESLSVLAGRRAGVCTDILRIACVPRAPATTISPAPSASPYTTGCAPWMAGARSWRLRHHAAGRTSSARSRRGCRRCSHCAAPVGLRLP